MWLSKSSVGRKVVMSVSGVALVLFLLFHMAMNLVAVISTDGYNAICKFLGANWYALVGTAGLAVLVLVLFVSIVLHNRSITKVLLFIASLISSLYASIIVVCCSFNFVVS